LPGFWLKSAYPLDNSFLKTGVHFFVPKVLLAHEVFVKFKKISHLICLTQFKLGEFIFPMFEPILRFFENKDPEVRRHFNQALTSMNEKKQAIALLNLNMVLSLNPRHFLARVFRGRIYIKEGQYRLASEDYLEANKISQYRFIHYDLYREYFRSVNKEFGGVGGNIIKNFDQVFETLQLQQDSGPREGKTDLGQEVQERLAMIESGLKEDINFQEFVLSPDEVERFTGMGPITQQEIEETDWDQLADDLMP
jgi:tetratricopeptide (TPR) repeat protein